MNTQSLMLTLAVLAASETAGAQAQAGKYTDQDFTLTRLLSATACEVADGIMYDAPLAAKPVCVLKRPTGGGPPRMKLVFPKNTTSDKCLYLGPIAVPSNIDASRPAFFRIAWEQIDGLSTTAPAGCTANPTACTAFTVTPYYLTEGSNLNTLAPGATVWSDLMASQNSPYQTKYTGTARDVADMVEATGRKPVIWKVCRPPTRPGQVNNVAFTAHVLDMYMAWPLLPDGQEAGALTLEP